MIDVRLLRDGDLAAVCEIVNHYIEHTGINFRERLQTVEEWRADWSAKQAAYPWLVASLDDEVVGVAYASPWSVREAYAWSVEVTIYLRPDAGGQGIGRALYGRLLEVLDAQGYHRVMAGVALPNAASEGLHEAMGFRRVGVLERIGFKHGRWLDVAWYERHAPGSTDAAPSPVRPVAEVMA